MIMTDNNKNDYDSELDNFCEECKKEDESVKQNLILIGYKICNSCKTSKTIFPIQVSVAELPTKFEAIYRIKSIKGAKAIIDALKIFL